MFSFSSPADWQRALCRQIWWVTILHASFLFFLVFDIRRQVPVLLRKALFCFIPSSATIYNCLLCAKHWSKSWGFRGQPDRPAHAPKRLPVKVTPLGKSAHRSDRPENLRSRNLLLIVGFYKHVFQMSTIFLSDKLKVLLTFHLLLVFSRGCVGCHFCF